MNEILPPKNIETIKIIDKAFGLQNPLFYINLYALLVGFTKYIFLG